MQILYYVAVFYVGLVVGAMFIIWQQQKTSYSGTLKIIRNPDKTVYSLEIDDELEILEAKRKVVFQVKLHDPLQQVES